LAGWARYLATVPAAERAPDPRVYEAAALARGALTEPVAFTRTQHLQRAHPDEHRFRDAFESASRQLAELGPFGAIAALLGCDHTKP
jgi:hypothetical protein